MCTKKLLWLILILFIALTGCSNPKIDTSTDETMKASIAKVGESLPENERAKFFDAIKIVSFNELDLKDLFAAGITGTNTTMAKVKQTLNGKTGAEVIEQAEQIAKERKEKEGVQALSEIKELEEKQIKAKSAKVELAKFQVLRSRFYKRKRAYYGEELIIEITVKNGTKYPVSAAYFRGTLASPGRSVPWLTEDFNYSISGGLEPGETAKWTLSPNMFSNWGKVQLHNDAVFTVEVTQIDGANKSVLLSSREFSDNAAERLAELKQKYK